MVPLKSERFEIYVSLCGPTRSVLYEVIKQLAQFSVDCIKNPFIILERRNRILNTMKMEEVVKKGPSIHISRSEELAHALTRAIFLRIPYFALMIWDWTKHKGVMDITIGNWNFLDFSMLFICVLSRGMSECTGEPLRTASINCGKIMIGKNLKFWQFIKIDRANSVEIF